MEKLNTSKLPFSIYDTFAFVIPGITSILSIFLFELWCKNTLENNSIHTPVYTMITKMYNVGITNNLVLAIGYLLLILTICYVTGHIIASAANIFLDRMLVDKGHGYPYESLLKMKKIEEREWSKAFYRGMFFWANVYFIIQYISYWTNKEELGDLASIIFWVLCALIGLKIVISTPWLEDKYIKKRMKSKNIFLRIFSGGTWLIKGFYRYIFPIFYNLIGKMLSHIFQTKRSFNASFIKKYGEYFKENFHMRYGDASTNNHWLPFCYILENSTYLRDKLLDLQHHYFFARNLSMGLYLSFIYCFIYLRILSYGIKDIGCIIHSNYLIIILIPIIILFTSILLLIRYYYIYHELYSKFLFRSYYYLNVSPKRKNS